MEIKKKSRKESDNYPETHYFNNEERSDVVFIVEGQRLSAQKLFLSVRNNVFRIMFSENFKESTDKEVVIKDTTFEALNTMIQFLYFDKVVLKDSNDLILIEEVFKLSDRYEANRLMEKMGEHLNLFELDFDNLELISRIAFKYEIREMIEKVKTFIENNFDIFVGKEAQELKLLNESTDGNLLEIMANNYRKTSLESHALRARVNQIRPQLCTRCGKTNHYVMGFKLPSCRYCQNRFVK